MTCVAHWCWHHSPFLLLVTAVIFLLLIITAQDATLAQQSELIYQLWDDVRFLTSEYARCVTTCR